MRRRTIFVEAVQNFGGARISTLELAKRLREDNDVSMIDFYGSCIPFVEAVKANDIELVVLDKREEPYIINRASSFFINFFNKLLFIPHWFKLRKALFNNFKQSKPEFVLVNNYKTLLILSFLPNKRYKTVFFARGWFVPHKINFIKRLLLKTNVDKFLCVSEATRHALYCGKIARLEDMSVVHNAINEDKLSHEVAVIPKGIDDKIIFHSGGFLPEKGQHISLEIARKLKTENVKFKLILAGLVYKGFKSQQYYQNILKLIKDYNLQEDIIVVTNQTNVIPYFRACDLLIHPSSTEGLPRVVMEAMILKKPVIANAVGGVSDYIISGFTGYMTDFNDVEEYVSYIKRLFDEEHYHFISQNAYNLVKTCFTEQKQVNSFKKIFK